jgi:protein arginine kinase
MRLADLTRGSGEWLSASGPAHDVVISSRIRLARNLAGMPFLSRCSDDQLRELNERLRDTILSAPLGREVFFVDLTDAGETDRRLLVERQLISRQHAEGEHPRGVVVSGTETASIMINEEDHLRMQVLRSGLQLEAVVEEINQLDDLLEQSLDYAFHRRLGYLTACPTNVGTGLRISVMLHLPALKLSGTIQKAFNAARDMRLAFRGLFGEGTEAAGDFFQLSNQMTLGRSEQEIVEEFSRRIIPEFIEYERKARRGLLAQQRWALEDKIFRAQALLRAVRKATTLETMYLLSLARLGVQMGLIEDMDIPTISELFLLTQPAHLQKIHNREMDSEQRDVLRATTLRKRLGASG